MSTPPFGRLEGAVYVMETAPLLSARNRLAVLVMGDGPPLSVPIADPPAEVKKHRHGACLQLVEAPWFLLHWNRPPHTLDDGLLYMERMLDESLNAGGR